MIRAARLLSDFLEQRYPLVRHVSARTLETMGLAVRSFGLWLERPATLDDLQRENLLNWMAWRRAQDISPSTVYGNRRDLLTLWNCACAEGLLDQRPERIPTIKLPEVDPDGWLKEEWQAIVNACKRLDGYTGDGIPRAKFFYAFAHVTYSTGLRLSAVLNLRRDALDPDGSIVAHWKTQKTRHSQRVWLSTSAVQAVNQLGDGHTMLLPWPHRKETLRTWWHRALDDAGVRYVRYRTGPQKLRRTAASHLEAEQPGRATKFLGHRSADLAAKHYLDPRIVLGQSMLPPSLDR